MGDTGWSLLVSVATPEDSTQQCPAQSNKGRRIEGMRYGNLDYGGQ